jgi:protocatechuate 3,4-dioxygenase beta subunit
MNRLTQAIWVFLSLIQCTSLLAAQAQRGASQNVPPKASVSGVVVRAGTSEPIPRAQVTLSRVIVSPANVVNSATFTIPVTPQANAGQRGTAVAQAQPAFLPPITTDEKGRFEIKDIEPGSYRAIAARNGFTKQEYGQRSLNGAGTVFVVAPGQQIQDINFRLTPAATITGRVVDGVTGDPLPGMTVQAMRATYDANGKQTLQPAASDRTNDLGEYRLYWINPGRYYITADAARSGFDALMGVISQAASLAAPSTSAEAQKAQQATALFGPSRTTNEVVDPGYFLTYYPGTPDLSRAAAVDLQSGAEARADFNLVKGERYRIRGRALDAATGRPPQDVVLSVSPRNAAGGASVDALFGGISGMLQGNKYTSATGEFELRDVAPGSYWLQAMVANVGPNPSGAAPPSAADPAAVASAFSTTQIPVDVFGRDLENVTLVISPGIPIQGRVRIDGVSNANQNPFGGITLSFQSTTGGGSILSAITGNTMPAADGNFTFPRVTPGEYKLSVNLANPNMYVKEARLDQTDVLQGISIGDRVDSVLDVVLGQNGGQLDGTVTGADLKPVSGVKAVLVPERLRNRLDLYKTAITNQDGRFTIRGLTPGDYRLLAWEDIEPFAYFDAEVIRQYEALGKPVRIQDGSKETAEVKIIPAGQ